MRTKARKEKHSTIFVVRFANISSDTFFLLLPSSHSLKGSKDARLKKSWNTIKDDWQQRRKQPCNFFASNFQFSPKIPQPPFYFLGKKEATTTWKRKEIWGESLNSTYIYKTLVKHFYSHYCYYLDPPRKKSWYKASDPQQRWERQNKKLITSRKNHTWGLIDSGHGSLNKYPIIYVLYTVQWC